MVAKVPDILTTHPWLTFHADFRKLPYATWMLLGEAESKCEHIASSLLEPAAGERLHELWLAKGAQATTAIEGNTLTVDQVEARIAGKLKLPKSSAYLGIEIDNVVRAINEISTDVIQNSELRLTPEAIRAYHALVLASLEHEEHVVPGEFRKVNVGVGSYRPPDWRRVPDLMDELCVWLASPEIASPREHRVGFGILRAVIAHLYMAWIHAFGDGNGRTARLVEFGILVQAGVPTPAAHVLSNHYNRTRSEYYRQLERASASGGDIVPFITYAVQGLVDGLTEQIETIYDAQRLVLWRDYVYERFGESPTKAKRRQRLLVLEMSRLGKNVALEDELTSHSPIVAAAYARTSPRTLQRDLAALIEMGLLVKGERGGVWVPDYELLRLRPARRETRQRQTESS